MNSFHDGQTIKTLNRLASEIKELGSVVPLGYLVEGQSVVESAVKYLSALETSRNVERAERKQYVASLRHVLPFDVALDGDDALVIERAVEVVDQAVKARNNLRLPVPCSSPTTDSMDEQVRQMILATLREGPCSTLAATLRKAHLAQASHDSIESKSKHDSMAQWIRTSMTRVRAKMIADEEITTLGSSNPITYAIMPDNGQVEEAIVNLIEDGSDPCIWLTLMHVLYDAQRKVGFIHKDRIPGILRALELTHKAVIHNGTIRRPSTDSEIDAAILSMFATCDQEVTIGFCRMRHTATFGEEIPWNRWTDRIDALAETKQVIVRDGVDVRYVSLATVVKAVQEVALTVDEPQPFVPARESVPVAKEPSLGPVDEALVTELADGVWFGRMNVSVGGNEAQVQTIEIDAKGMATYTATGWDTVVQPWSEPSPAGFYHLARSVYGARERARLVPIWRESIAIGFLADEANYASKHDETLLDRLAWLKAIADGAHKSEQAFTEIAQKLGMHTFDLDDAITRIKANEDPVEG
jgi:hypothetical protein